MNITYRISGTHCRSCEILLERSISAVPGVRRVRVNHRTGIADVRWQHGVPPDESAVAAQVAAAGYRFGSFARMPWFSSVSADWIDAFTATAIVFGLYLIYRLTGADRLGSSLSAATTASGALVVGLIAGVSTCMALIGSMVLGVSARYAQAFPGAGRWERIRPNLAFNAGRIAGFALLGGAAGLLGSAFRLSGGLLGFLVVGAGVLMVLLGIKLTDLMPRLETVTLPASVGRLVGIGNGPYRDRRAALTGALTFFLPCAFTQTMQVLAVSTGSFAAGAAIMSAFALGTTPGLLAAGSAAGFAKGAGGRMFLKVAGIAVLVLGIANIGNGWNLTGITLGSQSAAIGKEANAAYAEQRDGKQFIATTQGIRGYAPSRLRVKAGIPVVWTITSTNASTCASSIVVPSLGISRLLELGANVIEFTPSKPGLVKYSCGMGMFTGVIEVVE